LGEGRGKKTAFSIQSSGQIKKKKKLPKRLGGVWQIKIEAGKTCQKRLDRERKRGTGTRKNIDRSISSANKWAKRKGDRSP